MDMGKSRGRKFTWVESVNIAGTIDYLSMVELSVLAFSVTFYDVLLLEVIQ